MTRGSPQAKHSNAILETMACAQPPPIHPANSLPSLSISAFAAGLAEDDPMISTTVATA